MLVVDSGALSRLSQRSQDSAALVSALVNEGMWPPLVPTAVLVESLHRSPAKDALTNRLLKTCDIVEDLPEALARRAAYLRTRAGKGSAVNAIVVAVAEPGGSVLTSDPEDLLALSVYSSDVVIEPI